MILQGKLTAAEYFDAQLEHLRRQRSRRWFNGVMYVLSGLLLALFLLNGLIDQNWRWWLAWPLPIFISARAFDRWMLRHRTARIYAQQQSLQAQYDVELSDEGVRWLSATSDTEMPWAHYVKWAEGERVFLLYHSDCIMHIVPKRFFKSERTIEEFRALMTANVAAAA